MPRATIIIIVDSADSVEKGKANLEEWRDQLDFVSENSGCGCCVDIYDIEGPGEAIAAIPEGLSALSDWSGWRSGASTPHGMEE